MIVSSKYIKYEKSLIELIAIALNKNTFAEMVKSIYKGKSIDDIKPESREGFNYIEKILTEEIEKQFGDPNRPFIELILNAIDAKSQDYVGEYMITVLTKFNDFIVSDNGKSMTLEEVLSNFIIPFYSKKDTITDIGRFGVGFLSNLSFCLEEPRLIYVKVNVCTGKDAFRIVFHSETENVRDMMVSIERVDPIRQGTDVIITRDMKKAPGLLEYITRYLDYFNPVTAKVKLNKKVINEEEQGAAIIRKFPFKKLDKVYEQALRVSIQTGVAPEESALRMYSQGVFIRQKKINYGNVKIDLPAVVDVVEGRDEFKQDEAFSSAIENFWKLLLHQVQNIPSDNIHEINAYRELIPALEEGLGVNMLMQEEFTRLLFPRKTYVVDSQSSYLEDKEFKNIVDFFGEEIFNHLYQPKHSLSEKRWKQVLGSSASLIDNFCSTLVQGYLTNCQEYVKTNNIPFHNVGFIKEKAYYRMVKIQTRGGISPFLKINEIIYLNSNSKFLRIPDDFISEFNNRIYYLRASGLKEKDIGREFV